MMLHIPWAHIFAFLGAVLSNAAYAQGYPAKSVRYIVPSLPGGGSDIVGRMMAAHLSQTFKQQVVVDNRAGGGGNIGAEIAAKSMPDGHTIFQMAVTHTINVTLYKNLAYDPVCDFTPITHRHRHAACADRALAVTSPKRVPLIPEYPTIAESGYPGYESETWFGLMLPVKTPKNVVATVRSAALAALNAPEVNKRLIELAFIPIGDSAAEFTTYIQSEIATYGKLARELKVTSE